MSNQSTTANSTPAFDAQAKERQLKAESDSWNTTIVEEAREGDIPVIDIADYLASGSEWDRAEVAAQLKAACEETGFFSVTGHQVSTTQLNTAFEKTRQFHALPLQDKKAILMDRPDWPVGGIGYLPIKNTKLPARDTGNVNEAFIIKCDHKLGMDDNQWPDPAAAPGFREVVTDYANSMHRLGMQMLPLYATALDMPPTFFDEAFDTPLYRLRMTHYPPVEGASTAEFGIAPHVDTSFCTILAQDQAGLCIFSERRQQWISAPALEGAFIVNTGELLKQWTNDRFISVKHFANNNTADTSRYSIPFFFNANPTYKMTCVPSCCGPDNPAKYPPISYLESQGVVQGE
ncbi:hypothetical protein AB833_29405 [Chromatiales bacterium (ex Bugula neritina AB1)]|nr:hypothetical protein AB833_29405 [Chromatiales bacterium (ex Bugula neritina AB1)]